tara:strand:- start:210 stop:500 length:291 start_codon:yes stop_codon:yes gene_type:complete
MKLTKEQQQKSLEWDADAVMEQIIMQHSRHMHMSALVEHQLMYPDMSIREFFAMARQELDDQDEELEEQEEYRNEIDLSLEENAVWDNPETREEEE